MKKELFSIPNLMGYFRIIMIPVFLVLYYHAETPADYTKAFVILAISMLTDLFDGKIARKFHMETELGKALDPIADKLTQFSLAIAATIRYPLMIVLVVFFFLKELYMGLMGLYLKKKKNVWNGAKWFGKVSTGILDVGVFALLLFPKIPPQVATIIILIMLTSMVYSQLRYMMLHASILKEEKTV